MHLEEVAPEHKDEVYRLLVVQTPEHLEQNDLAQLWLANKYKLSMSSFSYDLLMTFLQEQNYMMLRTMINDHLAISTFAGYPSSQTESVTLLDKASQELMEASQPDVHWGVFSEIRKWYDKPDEEDEGANGADGEAAAAESEEEAASKKRKRETAAKRKAARSKAEAKAPPANQRVPIQAEIGIEAEKEFLADIKARANLAPDSLPSIAFYTIFNTHNNMTCSAVSRDAGMVATGFGDSAIKLWDVQGGSTGQPSRFQEAQKLYMDTDGRAPKYKSTPSVYNELIGHSQSVTSLDFSPDGAYLLSSSADGTVRLWSNETKTNVVCYRGHNFPVWQTRFATLGYYFASASHDRTARLWVTSNVHAMRIFAGHGGDVNTVAFHPNYYYLFTGSTDKTLRLWEVQTGDCVRIFTGHAAAIYDAKVCPDGKYAVSAGEDATVNVWDLAAGKRCAAFKGHTGPVWSIDISNDGTLIASGSSDQSVRLWDLRMVSDSGESNASLASSSAVDRSKFEKAQLGAYFTKSTPVVNVSFTRRNLLTASGPFRPPTETTQ
jgi:transcription initiation factor TFIID subunit 5